MLSSSFQQFLWNTNEIYFLNYWYPKGYFVIKVEEDMIWTYWNVFHICVHHWANISKAFGGTQDQLFHFAILAKGPHNLFVCFSYFWGTRSQLLSDLALLSSSFFGSLSCCCGYQEELSSSCFFFFPCLCLAFCIVARSLAPCGFPDIIFLLFCLVSTLFFVLIFIVFLSRGAWLNWLLILFCFSSLSCFQAPCVALFYVLVPFSCSKTSLHEIVG